jgi:signal transduction histidine kinase
VNDPDRSRSLGNQHRVGSPVHTLHVDRSGALWVGTRDDLFRVEPGGHEVVRVSRPGDLRQIDSITSDTQRGLLLADTDRGLLRLSEKGNLVPIALPGNLQHRRILTIFGDRRHRVWIAFATGGIAILDSNDRIQELDKEDGLDAGPYRIIHEDSDGVIWLGGSSGMSRYGEDGHVISVHADDHLPIRAIRAIEHDQFGYLWLGTSSGFVRIRRDGLRRAPASSHHLEYTLYDKSDGLAGLPTLLSDATAAHTNGGALWFVTQEGISVVQAQPPDDKQTSRPISIVGVSVDDQQRVATPGLVLPAGTRRLQIDYTALNLSSPQKTRFRFRLDGIDSDWVETGSRRQATYTNLGAGSYRFRVAATSVPGKWDEGTSVWEFSIQPHFYATWWFLGSCGALVPFALWAGWAVRLRQERIRFAMVLAERARLSREIHDTLLQGLVGVGLQCDALADDLRSVAPETKDRFVRLRQQTTRYIKEARQAIAYLRAAPPQREALAETLQRLGEQIATPQLKFSAGVKGGSRVMDFDVEQQVIHIAREAVTNAVLHAQAQHLQVDLEYGETAVLLRVSDDGCGFDSAAATNGHYGIVSMRERAKAVHGTFRLETGERRGTCIEVTVPFATPKVSTATT